MEVGDIPILKSGFFEDMWPVLPLKRENCAQFYTSLQSFEPHLMPSHPKFLVVDDNVDSRFLLVKTLLRKFPRSVIHETREAPAAIEMVTSNRLDAVISHRAADVDGLSLVRSMREANPAVPIVMVSGIDRSKAAREAGATVFLSYDEWLRIGSVVAAMISSEKSSLTDPEPDAAPTGR